MEQITNAVPEAAPGHLARDRQMLEMVEAAHGSERFAEVAAQYRAALADPEQLSVMRALTARFEALGHADPDDPEVELLARDLLAAAAEHLPGQASDAHAEQDLWQLTEAAFRVTLPETQRRCLELLSRRRSAGRS